MVGLIKKCFCYFICRGTGLVKPAAVYGNVYISSCAFSADLVAKGGLCLLLFTENPIRVCVFRQ